MTPENPRDEILQNAAVRAEPVTLPPTVIVPPGQLGPGTLPAGVLTPSGVPFGQLAGRDTVDLGSQVVGALAAGNVSGLGALALVSNVNAQTQVYNLGQLAYANNLAADQIGAGTLAAGVIYAGSVLAENLTGTSIYGKNIRSASELLVGGDAAGNARIALFQVGAQANLTMVGQSSMSIGFGGTNTPFGVDYNAGSANGAVYIGSNMVLAGGTGSRILLKNVLYNADAVIDGVNKSIQIRITG